MSRPADPASQASSASRVDSLRSRSTGSACYRLGPGGDAVSKLPDRLWRLPRREDDEAAEEGIGRILALSDGVFAIAITVLVFGIAVPSTTSASDLPHELLRLWPRYLAYAISFVVIARFWVTHRRAFRLIAH